ncbi:hypothetical protein BV898_15252 [Hypsibius exemplaris]|uniref:Uncharacterized protein n=1 Tax=Hypsibius exemplaris TaxID=2072580 RepID=A0A9X6NDK3_HYPEX|nr:hypothetical protein BV898_15252 [Hypsibius exemplaris]
MIATSASSGGNFRPLSRAQIAAIAGSILPSNSTAVDIERLPLSPAPKVPAAWKMTMLSPGSPHSFNAASLNATNVEMLPNAPETCAPSISGCPDEAKAFEHFI